MNKKLLKHQLSSAVRNLEGIEGFKVEIIGSKAVGYDNSILVNAIGKHENKEVSITIHKTMEDAQVRCEEIKSFISEYLASKALALKVE